MKHLKQKLMKLLIIITLLCCSKYMMAYPHTFNDNVSKIKWLYDDTSKVNNNLKGDTIFSIVDKMPEFPGGMDSLMRFIVSHIQVPEEARKSRINGNVDVQFIVSKQGKVLAPKVFKGIGKGCDEEAIRAIQKLPDWIPGLKDGKPVNVYYIIPISFRLGSVETIIFIEEMPEFPGGKDSLMKYLRKNLR